jgi:hypothetical protein
MLGMIRRSAAFMVALAAGSAGACGAPAGPWREVGAGGARLYEYPDDATRFAPGDRGAYVVTARDDTPAGRRALRDALAREVGPAAAGDAGAGGLVVRLDPGARQRVAALAAVGAVTPLPPTARRGPIASAAIRIDLFGDATPAEADAVAAWIGARGGTVTTRGATWLDADLGAAAAAEAARLGPVRWVEGHSAP